MKILLSGAFNPHFEALPDYLVAALGRLGHDVRTFNHRSRRVPGRLCARLPVLDRLARADVNRRFLRTVRDVRPDLVIVNQGMVLTRGSVLAARSLGARCVNWFSDYPAEFEEGLARAQAYDAFYLGSSYGAWRHREAGHRHGAWLPFACDPEVHRPVEPRPLLGDTRRPDRIVFVGSLYPERHVLLRFLRGLPVGVWGPGWERVAGDPHLAPMIRGGALRPSAWRALYARADVVLNMHYGAFGPREVSGDLANTRLFEILGCGVYQVVDRQGDVLRLFREGEHLGAFSTGEELRARVEEALADADLRRRVSEGGRRAVLAAHTYEHRARTLVDPGASGFEIEPLRRRRTADGTAR